MKTQTTIELIIKDRREDHLVTTDRIKGISPDTAIEILYKKYATKQPWKEITENLNL